MGRWCLGIVNGMFVEDGIPQFVYGAMGWSGNLRVGEESIIRNDSIELNHADCN